MAKRCLPLLLLLAAVGLAADIPADSVFFAKLEGTLRADYFSCTGDTTQLPVGELVLWKHWIDSIIGAPDYPAAAKEYRKKTGRSPVQDGPCVVVMWKRWSDSLAAVDSITAREKADLKAEVDSLRKRPCDIAGIPFGVTRQSFALLAGKARITMLSDQGEVMLCRKIPVGKLILAGQFHFNEKGRLDRYELEGPSFPVDSLNGAVWPLVEQLTAIFQHAIGDPPLLVNRIGRHEIVEGKLSICKVWSEPRWSVTIGISVKDFRYYAKMVVMDRPVPEEKTGEEE